MASHIPDAIDEGQERVWIAFRVRMHLVLVHMTESLAKIEAGCSSLQLVTVDTMEVQVMTEACYNPPSEEFLNPMEVLVMTEACYNATSEEFLDPMEVLVMTEVSYNPSIQEILGPMEVLVMTEAYYNPPSKDNLATTVA